VRVNGAVVDKPSTQVSAGDRIAVERQPKFSEVLEPEPIALDVIYEDDQVLVINKPAGLVVHPGPGHPQRTLVNALLSRLPGLRVGEIERPGIVHRLDKETSGVILVAKTDEALESLQGQFKRRQVKKIYLGLVDGAPPTPEGEVEAAIGRDPRNRQRFAVLRAESAKHAVTRYRTRERFAQHALLELQPLTGRTHQIRIHMKALGCPIVGDRVYGHRRASLPVERQMLHAWQLEFELPGDRSMQRFEAPLSADFEAAIAAARAA
jgi:23S rRNA pseudouridine1911/1915/1917 synthase